MKSFEYCKAELQRRRESVKYFTRAFYKLYTAAVATIERNEKAGIDDSYTTADGIYTCHAWDGVRESDFYRKNSGCYCEFLSVVR